MGSVFETIGAMNWICIPCRKMSGITSSVYANQMLSHGAITRLLLYCYYHTVTIVPLLCDTVIMHPHEALKARVLSLQNAFQKSVSDSKNNFLNIQSMYIQDAKSYLTPSPMVSEDTFPHLCHGCYSCCTIHNLMVSQMVLNHE